MKCFHCENELTVKGSCLMCPTCKYVFDQKIKKASWLIESPLSKSFRCFKYMNILKPDLVLSSAPLFSDDFKLRNATFFYKSKKSTGQYHPLAEDVKTCCIGSPMDFDGLHLIAYEGYVVPGFRHCAYVFKQLLKTVSTKCFLNINKAPEFDTAFFMYIAAMHMQGVYDTSIDLCCKQSLFSKDAKSDTEAVLNFVGNAWDCFLENQSYTDTELREALKDDIQQNLLTAKPENWYQNETGLYAEFVNAFAQTVPAARVADSCNYVPTMSTYISKAPRPMFNSHDSLILLKRWEFIADLYTHFVNDVETTDAYVRAYEHWTNF